MNIIVIKRRFLFVDIAVNTGRSIVTRSVVVERCRSCTLLIVSSCWDSVIFTRSFNVLIGENRLNISSDLRFIMTDRTVDAVLDTNSETFGKFGLFLTNI